MSSDEIQAGSLIVVKENDPSVGVRINMYLTPEEEAHLALLYLEDEAATWGDLEELGVLDDDDCKYSLTNSDSSKHEHAIMNCFSLFSLQLSHQLLLLRPR